MHSGCAQVGRSLTLCRSHGSAQLGWGSCGSVQQGPGSNGAVQRRGRTPVSGLPLWGNQGVPDGWAEPTSLGD